MINCKNDTLETKQAECELYNVCAALNESFEEYKQRALKLASESGLSIKDAYYKVSAECVIGRIPR